MDSLQIRTGQIRLMILDDAGEERGVFKFNPEDVESAKQVVLLQKELEEKNKEFDIQAEQCETPEEKAEVLSTTVAYFRGLVDRCFGEGSSDLLFGNNNTLSMFYDFFEGITPYYERASKQRMAKYKKAGKSK